MGFFNMALPDWLIAKMTKKSKRQYVYLTGGIENILLEEKIDLGEYSWEDFFLIGSIKAIHPDRTVSLDFPLFEKFITYSKVYNKTSERLKWFDPSVWKISNKHIVPIQLFENPIQKTLVKKSCSNYRDAIPARSSGRPESSPYTILGIDGEPSLSQLIKVFQELTLQCYRDNSKESELYKKIIFAYEYLLKKTS